MMAETQKSLDGFRVVMGNTRRSAQTPVVAPTDAVALDRSCEFNLILIQVPIPF
jgi:hypothetical protein